MPEKKTRTRKAVAAIVVRELLIALGFSLDEKNLGKADAGINKFKAGAESALAAVGRMAAVVGVALGAGEIVQMADAWTNVDSRIGLVTKSTAEQAEMQQKVFEIAQKTRQEYAATGDLFFKLSRSSGQLGASQQDVLDVTETVNKALVVGGASTQMAQATILQLSQALASGRLQGDELRSLSENASVLADEIARYYGVTIGQLKEMGKDGELTAEGVFKAILKSKAKMDKEFEKMPVTIEQSVTYALNRIGSVIFGINKETSVFQSIAKGIVKSADAIATALEKGIKAVGGWKTAFKLATIALISFGAAFVIFKEGLFTLGMWKLALQVLRIGVINLARSFWAFLTNPAFLTIAAITLGIMLLVLVLEDLYYWITGGDSVLGDWLGSWDDFKTKVNAWINKLVSDLNSYWKSFKDTIAGYIDSIINKFTELANKARSVFNFIRGNQAYSGTIIGAGGAGQLSPASMLTGSGGGSVTITQNFDFNQAIATNQPVTDAIRGANLEASKDAMGPFTRGIENVIYAYP
jgi:tape measure domain-containing protein